MKKITINKTNVAWDTEKGICTFNGIPAVSMWVNSTYYHIMNSIVEMVGVERFLYSQQKQGRQSVDDDWVIISEYQNFEEGLKEHSKLAAVGGWGIMSLVEINYESRQAVFRIHNGLEGRSQQSAKVCWGSGIIAGKLAGFCEKLFNCPCWPEQVKFIAKNDDYDEFIITESNKTLEVELDRLLHADKATKGDMAMALKQLEKEIKHRHKAENEAQRLANYDTLTGLTNRRYFNHELSLSIEITVNSKKNSALFFLDLDNFKDINDSLGHIVGDTCLEFISQRLLTIKDLIPNISCLSRIGGDEFTLLISDLPNDIKQAKNISSDIAKQILNVFEKPLKLEEQYFYQSASIGIVIFSNPNDSPDSLLKQADIALYKAKQAGKSQFLFFEEQFQHDANQRLYHINKLQHGLKDKQFLLHYQPILNRNNEIVAYEALLRWWKNDNEVESASQFIEIIEKSSLMIELGKFVFSNACQQLEKWSVHGLPNHFSHISINISPIEFCHSGFIDFITETISQFNIDPTNITLEITENLMLNDFNLVKNRMDALQNLGFHISLDDFGTGYSSLSYLHQLPFSELKIDRSFIQHLTTANKDQLLLRSIIAMSKSQELKIVVEGVETIEQHNLLKKMGCDFFQGYLLGKPSEPKAKIT
jgi:diguanylate cyclase (GGDEF)-like protein